VHSYLGSAQISLKSTRIHPLSFPQWHSPSGLSFRYSTILTFSQFCFVVVLDRSYGNGTSYASRRCHGFLIFRPRKMDVRARAINDNIRVLALEVLCFLPFFFLMIFFPWSRYVNHTLSNVINPVSSCPSPVLRDNSPLD